MYCEKFIVSGRVQGVGFRQFTWSEAQKIGVRGYVRNLPDGRVESVAEGTQEQLAAFALKIARGPSYSGVENVMRERVDVRAESFRNFDIR